MKKKICFPITSRVHYARQKQFLDILKKRKDVDLQLVVGGSVLLEKYGQKFLDAIRNDGHTINETLFNVIDGGNHVTMAKTAGLTALEFSNSLYKLNPDIVVIRGDRFEQLAMAMVAAYLNKIVVHIEGGDVTGTIDESIRHAITKLAHAHLVTNKAAARRVIQMGEDPKMVWNVGSPDVEFAASVSKRLPAGFIDRFGIGDRIDLTKPFIIALQHPVTTEANNREHLEATLEAVDELEIPTIWFWPNSDAGTAEMAKAIRIYREHGKIKSGKIHFLVDLLPEDFIALLKRASCIVGNSSAGIKESSYFGIPVVNVGTRQANRMRGENVLDVGYNKESIKKAIAKQMAHGLYKRSTLYYKP
ncbi:MAG: UDP-N-acetylglucosamine 2-epimerase, partial [Patescibacteria group bacterium]